MEQVSIAMITLLSVVEINFAIEVQFSRELLTRDGTFYGRPRKISTRSAVHRVVSTDANNVAALDYHANCYVNKLGRISLLHRNWQ